MGACSGNCSESKRAAVPFAAPSTTLSPGTTMTKSIIVNPSQFVREITADFKDHYDMGKKLGGGRIFMKIIRCLWTSIYMCAKKYTINKSS